MTATVSGPLAWSSTIWPNAAIERGDEEAAEQYRLGLVLGLNIQESAWPKKTGRKHPGNLQELTELMAAASFPADMIHSLDWWPSDVVPILLGKLGGEREDGGPVQGKLVDESGATAEDTANGVSTVVVF